MERYDQASAGGSGGEIVLGLVAPVGTDLAKIESALTKRLALFSYCHHVIRLSALLERFELGFNALPPDASEAQRMARKMDLGNAFRAANNRGDALVLAAIYEVREKLGRPFDTLGDPAPRSAIILNQLKRPEEVHTLREIYGDGFFLIGVASSEDERLEYLKRSLGMAEEDAKHLIQRDESEELEHGQQTRKTFQHADIFVSTDEYEIPLWRLLDLVFGSPFHTPSKEEHAMFMAFAASLRSADLSRQVGAVVVNKSGDILGSGANDVPRAGGGQYWPDKDPFADPDQHEEKRDWVAGYDSNVKQRERILIEIAKAVGLVERSAAEPDALSAAGDRLKHTSLFDLTEFGRAVHAEVAALMSCARVGIATRGASLFCTTFPCHNCTKHLISAGIQDVVYIEPYPKSRALELHGDAIHHDMKSPEGRPDKVQFRPFIGVAPRRYSDLFSLSQGRGRPLRRKDPISGDALNFQRKSATPRTPIHQSSYLERELTAAGLLNLRTQNDTKGGEDAKKELENR